MIHNSPAVPKKVRESICHKAKFIFKFTLGSMKLFILLLFVFVSTGCAGRNTKQLWSNMNEYVIVEERYLSDAEVDILKKNFSPDIIYDERGAFYIRQSLIEGTGYSIPIIALTPITMLMDGVHFIARGAMVPKNVTESEYDELGYHPAYLSEKLFVASYRKHSTTNNWGGAGFLGLLNAMSALGSIKF
jgi:hypothetical protein